MTPSNEGNVENVPQIRLLKIFILNKLKIIMHEEIKYIYYKIHRRSRIELEVLKLKAALAEAKTENDELKNENELLKKNINKLEKGKCPVMEENKRLKKWLTKKDKEILKKVEARVYEILNTVFTKAQIKLLLHPNQKKSSLDL